MKNRELYENNFVILKNFISKKRAFDLANKFKEYVNERDVTADWQVPNCVGAKYDFIPFVELLVEKTSDVSKALGENVLPAYSFARIYKKDCVLDAHKDRNSCEISITLNLEASEVWDFYIYTKQDEKKIIQLEPGDAVLYLGVVATHGRDKFEGDSCTQVFLHYVRVNGPNFDLYFDKNAKYTRDKLKNETFIRTYKMSNPEICENVITWFEANKDRQQAGHTISSLLNNEKPNTALKNSTDITLTFTEAYSIQELIEPLNFLWECVCDYMKEFEEVYAFKFTAFNFNIQKYTPPNGGYHVFHHERGLIEFSNRALVWMLYLNTVENKGETEWKYYNKKEKAEQGKVVLWPPDFTHTHRGVLAPTEEKYIMTGWYNFI